MTLAPKHIDGQRLISQFGDNPQLLARLGNTFIDQLAPWVLEFQQHKQAGDSERLGRLLHKMKGSCHAVCASAVAHEFENAEHELRLATHRLQAGLSTSLDWDGAVLLQLLQEMKAEFQQMLASQPGATLR
jgi:HPt (histidine-containing phosphotransfer) domain-containing protein